MTLPEFLGSIAAILCGLAFPIVAGVLGHGVISVLVAIPVGLVVGWVLGALMMYPVTALQDVLRAKSRKQSQDTSGQPP